MPNISAYPVRGSVAPSDRIFIANSTSDQIDSATLAQVVALASGGGGGGGGGGGSSLQIADGTHTVTDVTDIVISSGGTLAASGTGTATLSFSGGGGGSGGGPAIAPGWGNFWTGTAWNRPAASSLAWVSQQGASYLDIAGGPIQIYGGNVDYWHTLAKSVSGAFDHSFLFSANGRVAGGDSIGVLVGNSSTGNFIPFYIYFANPVELNLDHWNGLNTSQSYVSRQAQQNPSGLLGNQITLRVASDGTNLTFWYSSDPVNNNAYVQFYTESLSTYLIEADTVAFGYYNADTQSQHTSIALYGFT